MRLPIRDRLRLRLSIGTKRQDIAYGTVERRWHGYAVTELTDRPAEPIDFQSVAAFQLMVHRGSHLRWEPVGKGEPILAYSALSATS